MKKGNAKLRAALRGKAEARIKGQLVLNAIAEAEGLEPTEEEIQQEMVRHGVDHVRGRPFRSAAVPSASRERTSNVIDQKGSSDYSYGIVRNRKVFEFLEH